ncbi:hypothetical protein [Variovorax ginsengisoli]|uniref:ABC-type transport auxiliary lipoprotein component domain-containing protein n=1 Tax=Variovorax ginsengisoli TaxID=363844 RepID=A0ABT9SCF8_9BURK|nr:hypothetical protein [Variovorax ginsengisoli]MDP9901097.1 hypothetical protein [Variovorax ginsengisoli]
MSYEEAPQPAARPNGPPVDEPLRLPQPCTLYLPKVEDARPNREFAGSYIFMLAAPGATPRGVQSVQSGDAAQWTRSALQSLQRYGFRTLESAPASPDAARQVSGDVSLRLAHGWSAGLNLVSHVVLRVTYHHAGEEVVREYHGMGTRTNWNNGNGEYMAVLNLGIDEALRSMAADAAALCTGQPLQAQGSPL